MTAARDDRWWQDAACAGETLDVFFRADNEDEAKAICEACSARPACLEYAMRLRSLEGVWGGLTEREREQLRRQREKGRA